MGTFTGDLLRMLAHSGLAVGGQILGNALAIPMEEKSKMRMALGEQFIKGLPTMSQEELPAISQKLVELMGSKGALPTAMVKTGNVVGPTGESLAMTPVAGAPVTPEEKLRYLTPQPTLDQLKALTFQQMAPEERVRAMKGMESLGSVANYLNALTGQDRFSAMYGPGGTEPAKVRIAQSKVPIMQQQADASTTNAQTNVGELGLARDRYKNVDIPKVDLDKKATDSLIAHRKAQEELERASQAAAGTKNKYDIAIKMFSVSEGLANTARELDESYRKRSLKRPADVDSAMADAERIRKNAEVMLHNAWRMMTPEEQKVTKNPLMEEAIKNARNGHVETQKELDRQGIKWK